MSDDSSTVVVVCDDAAPVTTAAAVAESAIKSLNAELRNVTQLAQLVAVERAVQTTVASLETALGIGNGATGGATGGAAGGATSGEQERCDLLARCRSVDQKADQLLADADRVTDSCRQLQLLNNNEQLAGQLEQLLDTQHVQLREQCYRRAVERLGAAGDTVSQLLRAGEHAAAVDHYCHLAAEFEPLVRHSSCQHLARYAVDTLHVWFGALSAALAPPLYATLAELRYPFVNSSSSSSSCSASSSAAGALDQLRRQLGALARLESARPRSAPREWGFPLLQPLRAAHQPPPCLPVRLLLRPLVQRFRFHFCGDRATARIDRPQWYMSLTLKWIGDHEQFIADHVQPTLQQYLAGVAAWREFAGCLQLLMADRLQRDLGGGVLADDTLLSLTIDETLRTVRRLADTTAPATATPTASPPSSSGSPLLFVLRHSSCLHRWLQIEAKAARHRMDQLFAAENAWRPLFPSDNDQRMVTEVSHGVLSLLQAITQRYSLLTRPCDHMHFVRLQLELLEELRVRLLQMFRKESQRPLSESCLAVGNTAHHIRTTLEEWAELPFFLKLHALQHQLATADSSGDCLSLETELSGESGHHQPLSPRADTVGAPSSAALSPMSPEVLSLADFSCTVFDSCIQLFQRIECDVVSTATDLLMDQCVRDVGVYCDDDWSSKAELSNYSSPSLSVSACSFIQTLSHNLQRCQTGLAVPLYERVCWRVTDVLGRLLLERLVLNNRFSAGGAQQLHYDVTRCLTTVLVGSGGAESVCRQLLAPLLQACRLLTVPVSQAVGALYTLKEEDKGSEGAQLVRSALGVDRLTRQQAQQILMSRSDVTMATASSSTTTTTATAAAVYSDKL